MKKIDGHSERRAICILFFSFNINCQSFSHAQVSHPLRPRLSRRPPPLPPLPPTRGRISAWTPIPRRASLSHPRFIFVTFIPTVFFLFVPMSGLGSYFFFSGSWIGLCIVSGRLYQPELLLVQLANWQQGDFERISLLGSTIDCWASLLSLVVYLGPLHDSKTCMCVQRYILTENSAVTEPKNPPILEFYVV